MDLTNATNRIAAQGELVARIKDEVAKVIVGQEKLVDRLVLALVTDGHILLEGVPGLAKTLSVNGFVVLSFNVTRRENVFYIFVVQHHVKLFAATFVYNNCVLYECFHCSVFLWQRYHFKVFAQKNKFLS